MSDEATGYSRLRVDVRAVPVPERWVGCEYEYRHGFGKGLERDGVYNPVPHRKVPMRDPLTGTDDGYVPRREAWFAGYKAGKAQRQRST